jgi:large subunit ribosomal protein L21
MGASGWGNPVPFVGKSGGGRFAPPRGAEKPEGTAMYAVIKTGGKQYRVVENDVLEIEKVLGDAGATVEFTEVLLVGEGESVKVGKPSLSGAKVVAELVEHTRGPKLIAFKKRRRKNSRRKKGHRQDLSRVRITSITAA